MKLPSLVKVSSPRRFSITPRHYDPIKEEIEQRTSKIKRQLEAEGILQSDNGFNEAFQADYRSSIKGAFSHRSKIKSSPLIFEKTGLLRLIIFLVIVGGLGGYLYIGPDILYYLFYLMVIIGLVVVFLRVRRKFKNE